MSAASRSPEASTTSPSAVAPKVPSATALTASSLRRVPRRNDSISRRAYMVMSTVRSRSEELGAAGQVGRLEDQIAPLDLRRQRHRVAPAGLADARRVDHRAAVQAGDVGPLLVVPLGAAEQAGVERRGDLPALRHGLDGDGDEAHRLAVHRGLETLELG